MVAVLTSSLPTCSRPLQTQYRGVTMPLSWLAALSFLISTIASYSQVLLVMRHRAWYVKWRGPITAVRRLLVTLWVRGLVFWAGMAANMQQAPCWCERAIVQQVAGMGRCCVINGPI